MGFRVSRCMKWLASHLGIKFLYGLVNRREDASGTCVSPWHDMEEEMRKRNIPLFSPLKPVRPLKTLMC